MEFLNPLLRQRIVFVLCFATVLLIVSCKKNLQKISQSPNFSNTTLDAAATSVTYNLVWSDEFDGTTVNSANWNFEKGGGGWGNNEKQYYQAANATVTNGNLVITAKKQRVKGYAYTSARMTTQAKREFKYGKIEARLMLPMGPGVMAGFLDAWCKYKHLRLACMR